MKVRPKHLKRYKDIAMLFLRHGNSELARYGDLAGESEGGGEAEADASELTGDLERKKFTSRVEELVGESCHAELGRLQVGSVILKVMDACADAGIRIPAEIILLGKAMMNLDKIGEALSRCSIKSSSRTSPEAA